MPDIQTTLNNLSKTKKTLLILTILFSFVLFMPSSTLIPVKGATSADWNKDTFWYEPWGKSGVHKGVDIFAVKSTEVISPTTGIVLYEGEIELGGKVILTLGPNWRLHYFAHLDEIDVSTGYLLSQGETIGTVGDTGNAMGKQPHLHYSLVSMIPYVWNIDGSTQGWKKMFFLNPLGYIK